MNSKEQPSQVGGFLALGGNVIVAARVRRPLAGTTFGGHTQPEIASFILPGSRISKY